MSTFRARVSVDDGTLHTARPLTAPPQVLRLLELVGLDVADPDSEVTAVELVIETASESEHPIADSVVGTSSAPLPGGRRGEDVGPDDGTPYLSEPVSPIDDEDVADVPLIPSGQA